MGPSLQSGGVLPSPIPQVSLVVYPTRTVYTFQNPQVKLEVTFMTPLLPQDLDTLQPITYVTYKVGSNSHIHSSLPEGVKE